MNEVYLCWGKALKTFESTPTRATHHPAICHMLDVGIMARVLLEQVGTTIKHLLCDPLDGAETQKIRWLAFLVALHDLGKISPGFQYKRKDLVFGVLNRWFGYPEWRNRFLFNEKTDEPDHGRVLFKTFPQWLRQKTGCHLEIANGLARTLAAHHGCFPADFDANYVGEKYVGEKDWPYLREQVANELLKIFDLDWNTFPLRAGPTPSVSFFMTLAGLTSMADWLGSDESRFYYIGAKAYDPEFNLAAYAEKRWEIARQTLADLSLKPAVIAPQAPHSFNELFQIDDKPALANPCQKSALAVSEHLPRGQPALVIIETPMGSGKTEAALAIADRWLCQGVATGIYYALPTQATANQMLGRILDFLRRNSAIDQAELHLLHAHADLQPEYQKLMGTAKGLQAAFIESIYDSEEKNQSTAKVPGEIQASEWFTARKRGLLANFAVGTVDQALLAVLKQARHMFVRLYGLAGKVVIIDECHAYDTYTSTILEGLLSWLSAMNTPVILLSATLPEEMRRTLLQAYAPNAQLPEAVRYPCVIAAQRETVTPFYEPVKVAVDESDEGLKPVSFRLHLLKTGSEPKERWQIVEATLRAQLQEGGCALCVMNTVVEAQDLYRHLADMEEFRDCLHLFHARFPLGQRLNIEDQCKRLFGRDTRQRPRKAILIATQVAEQSLDVSFDLLITDLAPIDLILQRMGRTHRHANPDRPERLSQPQVFCLTPDLSKKETPKLGRAKKVYHPARLAWTALLLDRLATGKSSIELPKDVQDLIAAVYDPNDDTTPEHLKPYLEKCSLDNEIEQKCMQRIGKGEILPDSDDISMFFYGLAESNDLLEDEKLIAKTRLSDPGIVLILLHKNEQDQVFLDNKFEQPINIKVKPDRVTTEALLRQSVSISHHDCYEYFKKQSLPAGWEQSVLLRHCRAVVFSAGRYLFEGKELVLDDVLGLVLPR